MTPLERAARAACEAAGCTWQTERDRMRAGSDDAVIDTEWVAAARAVLEAIREPDEVMAEAMATTVRAAQHLVKAEGLRCDEARLYGLAAQAAFIDVVLSHD